MEEMMTYLRKFRPDKLIMAENVLSVLLQVQGIESPMHDAKGEVTSQYWYDCGVLQPNTDRL